MWFLVGLFVGSVVGVFLTSLLTADDLTAMEYKLRNEALEQELAYWKNKALALQRRVFDETDTKQEKTSITRG